MMRALSIAALAGLTISLSACGSADVQNDQASASNALQAEQDAAIPNEQESVESDVIAPFPGQENGADTANLRLALQPVQRGDAGVITGNVGGCTFTDAAGSALLTVGVPDDRNMNPIGVARIDGRRETLTGEALGRGYVDNGPVMRAAGLVLTVRRAAGKGTPTGIETTSYDADLVVEAPGGASRTYAGGDWACGV